MYLSNRAWAGKEVMSALNKFASNGPPPDAMTAVAPGETGVPQGTIQTRTLYVNVTGSLANLSMGGPSAGTWRLVDGKQIGVFGMGSEMDSQVATNQLRTALIHELKLLQDRSTFPVPLGVTINCVPAQEMTDLGEKFAYTVLPGVTNTVSQTIYQCDTSSEEGLQWRKDYPKWTAENLESEGVLHVDNNPWVFVHETHPVVALLRHNAGLIGCKIDDQPKIDQEWYKVTRQVLSACCQTLRSKVLSKVTSHDLNLFQVQIKRLNAENWDDMNDLGAVAQCLTKEDASSFISTPYSYMARLQIKYEIQTPS
jgi:hypothetical protein